MSPPPTTPLATPRARCSSRSRRARCSSRSPRARGSSRSRLLALAAPRARGSSRSRLLALAAPRVLALAAPRARGSSRSLGSRPLTTPLAILNARCSSRSPRARCSSRSLLALAAPRARHFLALAIPCAALKSKKASTFQKASTLSEARFCGPPQAGPPPQAAGGQRPPAPGEARYKRSLSKSSHDMSSEWNARITFFRHPTGNKDICFQTFWPAPRQYKKTAGS